MATLHGSSASRERGPCRPLSSSHNPRPVPQAGLRGRKSSLRLHETSKSLHVQYHGELRVNLSAYVGVMVPQKTYIEGHLPYYSASPMTESKVAVD